MFENSPLMLPEFETVFDCEVYSIDFMATDYVDLNNFDANLLRRGFLVLGRYSKPEVSAVSAYLQQVIQQHLSLESGKQPFDEQLSPLIANLRDQDVVALLKGDQEKVKAHASIAEEIGKQYLDVHYFTVPAPLYIEQSRKAKNSEWYHNAFGDMELHQKGLQRWFLIRMGYNNLLEADKVNQEIKQSSISDKEGTSYVMKNICRIFSPFPHFARIKDITSRKIKEAALETLVHLQKENNTYTSFYKNRTEIITLN